jgi:hypothetical protein
LVQTEYIGAKVGEFNLLNIPDDLVKGLSSRQFWAKYNESWLKAAIERGDIIIMSTNPHGKLIVIDKLTGQRFITGFGREYIYLWKQGYHYDPSTGLMLPPTK